MDFSLSDYQAGVSSGLYTPPAAYRPYMYVNRRQYRDLEQKHIENDNDVRKAFRELRRRVGREHFEKTYPIQSRTLHYSQVSFPAYRFILPEVLADDWLATVDWHKFQRDHVLHQPLAAYIVLKLLTGGLKGEQPLQMPNGKSLLDECVDAILKWKGTVYLREFLLNTGVSEKEEWFRDGDFTRALWKGLFIEAAYLAAVFHDMGYPWQYVNTLSNKLEHAGHASEAPTADAANVMELYGNRLMFCPLNGYRFMNRNAPATWNQRLRELTAKALRKTHGLPGAIAFLHLNDVLREYPIEPYHPIRQFCVEWAAMAIMMHDMPKLYWGKDTNPSPENGHMRVRLDVDPLSCVVALADVLQEFSRPSATFTDRAGDDGTIEVAYDPVCNSAALELAPGPMPASGNIVYYMKDRNALVRKQTDLANEHKRYFHEQYGYLDLSSAGVSRIEIELRLGT